jgi:DNA polymerase-3 subunit beta
MNPKDLICTMTGQQYRAAHLCTAKNDIRYYLNGMHIDAKNHEVVGTNGHIMYVAKIEPGPIMKTLIFESVSVLASTEKIEIFRHDDGNVITVVHGSKGTVQHICELIDGRFPDYRAVIELTKKREPCNIVGMNPVYLANVPKIFYKSNSVKLEMGSPTSAFHFTDSTNENRGLYVVMPTRI